MPKHRPIWVEVPNKSTQNGRNANNGENASLLADACKNI